MRYLSFVITVPVTIVVVTFAINNRGSVVLDPWPLDGAITLPAFVVTLVPFLVGFIVGGLALWTSAVPQRRRARQERQRLRAFEAERARTAGAAENNAGVGSQLIAAPAPGAGDR